MSALDVLMCPHCSNYTKREVVGNTTRCSLCGFDLLDEHKGEIWEMIKKLMKGHLLKFFSLPGMPIHFIFDIEDGSFVYIHLSAMEDLVRKAMECGKSCEIIRTFQGEDVDHETLPPNGYNYDWWERQSREYGREDEVTLNIVDGEPSLSVRSLGPHNTGWHF